MKSQIRQAGKQRSHAEKLLLNPPFKPGDRVIFKPFALRAIVLRCSLPWGRRKPAGVRVDFGDEDKGQWLPVHLFRPYDRAIDG